MPFSLKKYEIRDKTLKVNLDESWQRPHPCGFCMCVCAPCAHACLPSMALSTIMLSRSSSLNSVPQENSDLLAFSLSMVTTRLTTRLMVRGWWDISKSRPWGILALHILLLEVIWEHIFGQTLVKHIYRTSHTNLCEVVLTGVEERWGILYSPPSGCTEIQIPCLLSGEICAQWNKGDC